MLIRKSDGLNRLRGISTVTALIIIIVISARAKVLIEEWKTWKPRLMMFFEALVNVRTIKRVA